MCSDRKENCVIIFSKSPEAGKVKTRLKPYLNDEQCLTLHNALLQDTIQKVTLLDEDSRLYLTSRTNLSFAAEIPIFIQNGNDLGERMFLAFQETLKLYHCVVIIGIDSPTLPPQWIHQALSELNHDDVVLGPTEDGGYYLIGMNRLITEPFSNIEWSTEHVLQKSLQLLTPYKVHLLPRCFDVDQPADLRRLKSELESIDSEYVKNIKAWFRQNAKFVP